MAAESVNTSGRNSISASPVPEVRIESRSSETFSSWLSELPGSLAVTTYQAGKLALLGWRGAQGSLLMRQFTKPMGLAVGSGKLALATKDEITLFTNAPLLAPDLLPDQRGKYDALYLPRATCHTGDVNVHDVAFAEDGLWFVNSRFSCLSALSKDFSFVPRWKPSFISEIVPEDRCHLNGLAVVDGKPKYVTALGETDSVGGWRANKATGGVLIDMESGQVVLRGLSMPHSPRWHQGRLWLLNSGAGELLCFDPAKGSAGVVCSLPAYLRGLCLIGRFAVVGMCQIREKHIFGGLPVQQRHQNLLSGLAVIDLPTGQLVGMFEFTAGCTEIYDVQFLPGVRNVNVLNLTDNAVRQAFTAPEFSYWLRPENVVLEKNDL
ncbi:MAG: TIGR03032 family protein [Planctomyces sp.]